MGRRSDIIVGSGWGSENIFKISKFRDERRVVGKELEKPGLREIFEMRKIY